MSEQAIGELVRDGYPVAFIVLVFIGVGFLLYRQGLKDAAWLLSLGRLRRRSDAKDLEDGGRE